MEVPFFFWIFIMLFLMITELRKWIDMIMEYYEPVEKEEPLPECIKSMYS